MLTINQIHEMDVLKGLKEMQDESVHCIVTSPPYWGLRDYGVESQAWGGSGACQHEWITGKVATEIGRGNRAQAVNGRGEVHGETAQFRTPVRSMQEHGICRACQAWLGCLGLEPTLELYIQHLVSIFREARRVLRKDGTLWLNLGDCYFRRQNHNRNGLSSRLFRGRMCGGGEYKTQKREGGVLGLKAKDLCGLPWRVVLALQADGWYLRSDIIWAKPNPMPESVTDRPTRAHEYIFLLSRSSRYFFDMTAVKESVTGNAHARGNGVNPKSATIDRSERHRPRQNADFSSAVNGLVESRNLRSVWQIPAQPFRGAHFAVFPEKLVEICIKAGTSEKGSCKRCGKPWQRVIETEQGSRDRERLGPRDGRRYKLYRFNGRGKAPSGLIISSRTTGWRPACSCKTNLTVPGIVLDPLCGSGTTPVVAKRLGRRFIGIELKPEYVKMARERVARVAHLAA